jgi:putative tryptophan/tyrosine transport system substrate-binding protein
MRRREFIASLAGAVAGLPLKALAQQPTLPVIGFMSGRSPDDSAHLVTAIRQGLREGGFVEGKNVSIEFRWATGQYDQLPSLAADLVKRSVAVLAALGGDVSALAAKSATSTIPIVFGIGGDPKDAGLVASFNRPGGNATGYTLWTNEMEPKRIGLLHELVPGTLLMGVLLSSGTPAAAHYLQQIESAARTIGQKLYVTKAANDAELNAAFVSLVQQRVDSLLVAASTYLDTRRSKVAAFAAESRIPAIYQFREYVVSGGLISYGPRITDSYRLAGNYAAQILNGANPGELPVLQPTRFELVINLKTASALGLKVPNSMQLLADELIE